MTAVNCSGQRIFSGLLRDDAKEEASTNLALDDVRRPDSTFEQYQLFDDVSGVCSLQIWRPCNHNLDGQLFSVVHGQRQATISMRVDILGAACGQMREFLFRLIQDDLHMLDGFQILEGHSFGDVHRLGSETRLAFSKVGRLISSSSSRVVLLASYPALSA